MGWVTSVSSSRISTWHACGVLLYSHRKACHGGAAVLLIQLLSLLCYCRGNSASNGTNEPNGSRQRGACSRPDGETATAVCRISAAQRGGGAYTAITTRKVDTVADAIVANRKRTCSFSGSWQRTDEGPAGCYGCSPGNGRSVRVRNIFHLHFFLSKSQLSSQDLIVSYAIRATHVDSNRQLTTKDECTEYALIEPFTATFQQSSRYSS